MAIFRDCPGLSSFTPPETLYLTLSTLPDFPLVSYAFGLAPVSFEPGTHLQKRVIGFVIYSLVQLDRISSLPLAETD